MNTWNIPSTDFDNDGRVRSATICIVVPGGNNRLYRVDQHVIERVELRNKVLEPDGTSVMREDIPLLFDAWEHARTFHFATKGRI